MTDGAFVSPFVVEDPEALAATERAQRTLTESIRALTDACLRTRVADDELVAVAEQVDALTERLLATAQEEPLGLETDSDGRLRDHGNAMLGMRNPHAPPLRVTMDDEGGASATFTLGAAYEGPPGCVHGGIVAAVLDQVLGAVPARLGLPGMTATLDTTYRRPTPLGEELTCRGRVVERDGWKVRAAGEIRDGEDRVTAEAEALFVVPRWAREHLASMPTGDAAGLTGDGGAQAAPTS